MSQKRHKLASEREVLAVQGKFQRISSPKCQQKCFFSTNLLKVSKYLLIEKKQHQLQTKFPIVDKFFSKEL